MTLSHSLIIKKLELIEEYRAQLMRFLEPPDAEILSSPEKYLSIERVFQLLVDAMIDINQNIIRESKLEVPDDLQSTFYPLGENSVLPPEFARELAPIVGVRNRLVHQYEEIDKKLFLKNLRKYFSHFETYRKYIGKYLSQEGRVN